MSVEHPATGRPRNSALKDARLTYRACTLSYARSLQLGSPAQLVGQTDSNFLSDRSAAMVQAAEQRVLESGTTEITTGETLGQYAAGKFFVRSPVLNTQGQICGIEIFVVSMEELHRGYQLLVDRSLQMHDVVDHAPFGLLIHRNYELIYVNQSWLQLFGGAGAAPGKDEIRRIVPGTADKTVKTISSVRADGAQHELSLQSRLVRWNGEEVQAVYCASRAVGSTGSLHSDKVGHVENASNSNAVALGTDSLQPAAFVEKRYGHRRGDQAESAKHSLVSDETLLRNIKYPVMVCDGWLPRQVNKEAQSLLEKDPAGNYLSVENWFTQQDRTAIDSLADSQSLSIGLARNGQQYSAHISAITKSDGRNILVSLQPAVLRQMDLELSIEKLRDYVASAGDFFWEMDSELRLTHISIDLQQVLGVDNNQVLNATLDALTRHHVHADDEAEWKVLMADLNKHLPFRNREYKWLHKDGEKRVVRLSGVPVFDVNDAFAGYRGIGWDYTSQYHSASIVAYHASHDSLTGLVNRREFESRCDDAIGRAELGNQALCFIDLDNFKRVNDTAGHLAGDELLRQLSTLVTGLVRRSDVLARLGGDEFGLLIYDVGLPEASRLATQVRAEVEGFQFHWEGRQFSVGASIGLVMIDDRWTARSALFGAADSACYEAKRKGKNRVAVFSEEINTDRQGDEQWSEYLESAIEEGSIRLALQRIAVPEDSIADDSMIEILMRLPSKDGELLLPATVLPLAERFGLSVKLDKAVIEATLEWLEEQPHVSDRLELCCINLSAASINDESFLNYLIEALKKSSIDNSILCFEVSESAVSTNLTFVAMFMDRLGSLGCKFALDDFSGGLNAFTYLKKLPVSFVKINSTFIRAILEDPVHYAMVKSINDVSLTLGKKTIAESVESEAVLEKLRELGVSLVQGYHIAAPEIIDF